MPEPIDYNAMTEIEFLNKSAATMARHVKNIENMLTMMRNGQFIAAYQQLSGTYEGLEYLNQVTKTRVIFKGATSETNTNAKPS